MGTIKNFNVSLIAVLILLPSILLGQNDSISLVLKLEHEKAQVLHRQQFNGFTNGKLIIKTSDNLITKSFDTIPTTLHNDCMGDVNYALCRNSYRTNYIDSIISIHYITYKQSNLLSITLNNMIYEIGNVNFEINDVKNLINGVTLTYKYIGNSKFLSVKINKKLKLKLNESGYSYGKILVKEGKKSKIMKKIKKPIELLPGTYFNIQINEK